MRLNEGNRKKLGKNVIVPTYDRLSLTPGIVHIGLGHFHRAHFLYYMDTLLEKGLTKDGVFEVDIVPSDSRFIENLREQDYLYSLRTLSSDGRESVRVIGSILGYANQSVDPDKVHQVLTSDKTKLITLTITEKGYCYHDETSSLDFENSLIKHDLESIEAPKSAIGTLAKALKVRSELNLPVTIMSCDNVPQNGEILSLCITQFVERKYPEILPWIKENVAFPCTMVDRITPGTKEEDILVLKEKYDLDDLCAVHSEDFIQWVIEEKKTTELPPFEMAGALVVDDVKPYELMKIRLLNGSHSALSYPAYMSGITMVHDAASNPVIGKFIREFYMEEITNTLSPVRGIDFNQYKDKLISRFSNPYIADTILRLASDGSKKIANAILRPLEEALRNNIKADSIIFALALWEYFYIVPDMPIDDPKGSELKDYSANDCSSFLKIAGLSDEALGNPYLIGKMKEYIETLKQKGVYKAIEEYIS